MDSFRASWFCFLVFFYICMQNCGCSKKSIRMKKFFRDRSKEIQKKLWLFFFLPLVSMLDFLYQTLCLVTDMGTKTKPQNCSDLMSFPLSSVSSDSEDAYHT